MRALLALTLLCAATAHGDAPTYRWPHAPKSDSLVARVAPPPGAVRVSLPEGGFGAWLRTLPLLPPGSAVRLYDGRDKPRQDVHAAVVDLDIGTRDLQQCADAVMRLWAEYCFSVARPIVFHPDPGRPRSLEWRGGTRPAFEKFLIRVFADAGTASLAAELKRVAGPVMPGDVLIQGGYPGHALLVLDVAERKDGRRFALLGQSYMPAQSFHLLRNLDDAALSPWYDAAALAAPAGLKTPEWRPFTRADLRRFSYTDGP